MDAALFSIMDTKVASAGGSTQISPEGSDKMNSSINSAIEDTTPSDSGVQMLDSDISEIMAESLISQAEIEYEELKPTLNKDNHLAMSDVVPVKSDEETVVFDANSNVAAPAAAVNDAMTASACSTFDTESIVYRRKVRKQSTSVKAPKKRVSFHEDILKNTRTDNIHIEHGFITYKNGRKLQQNIGGGLAGRYSWCSEGDGKGAGKVTGIDNQTNQLCAEPNEDGQCRRVVYRNACSDVLDYGNSDIFDTNERNYVQQDNSGVFEYLPQTDGIMSPNNETADNKNGRLHEPSGNNENDLCRCSCSSSNSSLDSDENDKNCNRQNYGQAKSSSCDCIGINNANNNIIGENCYFSEPNIDNLHDGLQKKSVWNKEKKPKSSCLKKTKQHTNIIHEHDLTSKVKKFNVHDMNQLIDNSSKMLFGSLKSIFTLPLPERGVPEGSEDLQSVIECIPESESEATPDHKIKSNDKTYKQPLGSPPLKPKPFLSKSLDGSKQQQPVKKFVHNVDEQLRRKNEQPYGAPLKSPDSLNTTSIVQSHEPRILQRQEEIDINSATVPDKVNSFSTPVIDTTSNVEQKQFRNKFIINCESTVFEHTGVSYCYESNTFNGFDNEDDDHANIANLIEKDTPIAQPEPDHLRNTFMSAPIAKTFSNFFRSFKDSTSPTSTTNKKLLEEKKLEKEATDSYFALKMPKKTQTSTSSTTPNEVLKNLPSTISSSTISDLTNSTTSSSRQQQQLQQQQPQSMVSTSSSSNSLAIGKDIRSQIDKQSRHLASPLKKRSSGTNLIPQPQRYGTSGASNNEIVNQLLSPDLFNGSYAGLRGGCGRDSKSTILSEEFDDILTITTDTDKNESDIVIVDYPDISDNQATASTTDFGNLLKPPTAKTSLINRFLRNVTQKKILESSIKRNNFFATKLKNEQKLFYNNLYVPGAKPKNYELIDDLNAEIAMEIEMSGANSPRRELVNIEMDDLSRFELGIGEISIDIFNGNYLHILRDSTEQLMKVFKLYTGYSREGYMTPVLVFLTDKTLYVTDLVRNRLCSKFVLAYEDLDVILMGPYGNTVLLSNSARDMQQVLLAGGPYPADGLVANLELCARRSGSTLPAVGQLTLQHLAPLQLFVSENSSVDKNDAWMYYAVVNTPAISIGSEREPLGPYVKGFLMHRRLKDNGGNHTKQSWNPGYFLLKAGVFYMFNDSSQKLPSWAMALAECQGARRSVNAGRPHCFEIMLRDHQLLQLAAPDEYVASEWLQALLQAASGLFEMQEKHKTLGCTLVVTRNHLITLREDFTAPLRQLNKEACKDNTLDTSNKNFDDYSFGGDNGSLLSSTVSTPTKGTQRSCSSANSTPTKLSQFSRSTATTTCSKQMQLQMDRNISDSYTNMSSVYGKNSGIEILSCADIKEINGIKIPSHNDSWWCILEFSCQEVRECSDDLVILFASSSEMQRFLRLLEQLWQAKNNDLFPITVLDEDDFISEQCTALYMDINRSWEPLLTAALGYPL